MKLLHVMFWKMYFYFLKKIDSCVSFLPWSLIHNKGTCISKVISRERDSFEINSSSDNFWWIERRCIKNLVIKTQLESFQKFSRSNASYKSSSMLITEIVLTIFFLQNFKKVLLNFISLIVFINATRSLYNINFIFFN